MKNKIGSPVYGEDFLFRQKEVKFIVNNLKNGNSILLTGLRRVGKSSLLMETKRKLDEEKEIYTIHIDCQSIYHPGGLFVEILSSLPEDKKSLWLKVSKFLPEPLKNIEKLELGPVKAEFYKNVGDYWSSSVNAITNLFNEYRKEGLQIVLFLDELPFFFENLAEKKYSSDTFQQILATLKQWRNAEVPMIICGSINIRYFFTVYDMSERLLAGCMTVNVEMFTRKQAATLFDELLKTTPVPWWNYNITQQVLDITPDFIPFFLQYIFNVLSAEEYAPENIKDFYDDKVYRGLYLDFIYQFDDRLANNYDENEIKEVERILDALVMKQKLNKLANIKVLQKLIRDQFLIKTKEGYIFSLKLIEEWWREKRNL